VFVLLPLPPPPPLPAAAVPLDGDGFPAGPAVSLPIDDGIVRWRGRSPHRVLLAYARPRGYDYLSPAACSALLDAVHGEFERRAGHLLGNAVRGSFQDELPRFNSWTSSFARAFETQHGYALADEIAALWEDTEPSAARVRCDYNETRTRLGEAAFFEPLHAWHERHGLMLGCDQQSPARAGDAVAGAQLYGDYLAATRWFTAPGSDHWGDAKVHSSLAHLYGRPRTWLEGFHSTGWDSTLEETYDWLVPWLRAGATLFNPHAVYYSTRGGWFEWAPPSSCWRQPYWRHYSVFADAVARLCAVLSEGTHRCDVAVLYPTTTVHAGLPPDSQLAQFGHASEGTPPSADARFAAQTYAEIVGRMAWTNPQPGVLDLDARDFDVVDESSLERSVISAEGLVIGGERFRCIILPGLTLLRAATIDVLNRFCEAGGTLIAVGPVPTALEDGSARLTNKLRVVASATDLRAALTDVERRVDAPVPTLLRQVGDRHVLFVPAAFPRATRTASVAGPLQTTYAFDRSAYAERMTIRVRDVTGTPWLWDVVSGRRRPLEATVCGDWTEITVDFRDGPAALVIFELDDDERPVEDRAWRETPLTGPWESSLVQTLDNTWGDVDIGRYAGPPPFRVWSMGHRADPGDLGVAEAWWADGGDWRPSKATFGPHALALGPLPLDELPTADDWIPVEYSTTYGIARDPTHAAQFGPKGYVPEEFIRVPSPPPGSGVQIRTHVHSPRAGQAQLLLGCAATVLAWWNGKRVELPADGYHSWSNVVVSAGANLLELRLSDSAASTPSALVGGPALLGLSWALASDVETLALPEWIVASGTGDCCYETTIELPFEPSSGVLHVGSSGRVDIHLNGVRVGEQGEHGTYEAMGLRPAFHRYEIGGTLRAGSNALRLDTAGDAPVYVDLVAGDGRSTRFAGSSSSAWRARREGRQVTVREVRIPFRDPRAHRAAPRPHPLPDAELVEGGSLSGDRVWSVAATTGGRPTIEWFRFDLPPGARRLVLPAAGPLRCFVDGLEVAVADVQTVYLPRDGRVCTVRVEAPVGHEGGAAWLAPPRVEIGTGSLEAADWRQVGLQAYSGGVHYRRVVELDGHGRVELDLGGVRGTAEVKLNGAAAGVRFCGPWVFEIGEHAVPGANELTVTIFNTIGPLFTAACPSREVAEEAGLSGLLGPVVIRQHS
jgi:hypothetical protein